jgi:hypothetical protein
MAAIIWKVPMRKRAVLTWLILVPVAITNGALREEVIKPLLGERTARPLSGLTLSSAFLLLVYLMMRDQVARASDRKLLELGAAWTAASVVFEFGFGHYVEGDSWGDLLGNYNLLKGQLFPLVLASVMMSPLITKRIVEHQDSVSAERLPHQPAGSI